jgi:hypothetical protein
VKKNKIYTAIAIVILMFIIMHQCVENKEIRRKVKTLTQDTARNRDKLGRETVKLIASQMTIKELRRQADSMKISRNTSAVTQVKTKVVFKGSAPTSRIEYDTIIERDTTYISPIYYGMIGDKWARAIIYANKDTIKGEITCEIENLITYERKKKQTLVTVTNQNPHATNEVQTVVIKDKPKRLKKALQVAGAVAVFVFGVMIGGR